MSIKKQSPFYKASKRYIFNGIRHQGWTTEASIFEFIDNGIDAKADQIALVWEKNKNYDKENPSHFFGINDNGCGIPKTRMIPSFGTLGIDAEYQTESIGNYGTGGTAGLINLCHEGKISIKSTHSNSKETSKLNFEHTVNNDMPDPVLESLDYEGDNKTGTQIEISNVEDRLTESHLIKKCGVTYFPNRDRDSNFKLYVNKKEVTFVDPFYRDKNWEGLKRKTRSVQFGEDTLEMDVLAFYPDFEEKNLKDSLWDVRNSKGSLLRDNSGLYIKVGGRYINTGKHLFPGVDVQNIHNRLRFEITIPHDLMEKLGIEVNKSKVSLDVGNPLLEDLQRIMREECRVFIKEWNNIRGKTISEDDKKFLKRLNERFNSKLKKLPLPALGKGITGKLMKERRKFKGRNQNGNGINPTGSGRKRNGRTSPQSVPLVKFHFESEGQSNPNFQWERDDKGTTHIKFNIDTKWGKSIPRGIGDEASMDALAWSVYSWIHVGLEEAANLTIVKDYKAGEDVHEKMYDVVSDMTFYLNKVMR